MMRKRSINRKIRETLRFSGEGDEKVASAARVVLKLFRCWDRAVACAKDVEVKKVGFFLPDLPQAFKGARILFISDLHFPSLDDYIDKMITLLEPLEFDYCFLGGDYSNGIGDYPELVEPQLENLVAAIRRKTCDIYGVLGNHDIYRTAEFLDKLGVKMLINDSCVITRGGDRVNLVGLDDHHRFDNVNWQLAEAELPVKGFNILLSHSPDNCHAAADRGYRLMLSGHTHGGQLCLPGGFPLLTHSKTSRKFAKGYWKIGNLQGYTTIGTGSGNLGARLNSKPEICLFTLS